MAETYEKYLKAEAASNPLDNANRWMSIEDRMGAAMDLVDVLKEVRSRVEAFIGFYEADLAPTMQFIEEQRAKGTATSLKTAELAELDVQTVASDGSPTTRASDARLTLDDLKILLREFPQRTA